jgi:hypothetical protein
MFSDRFDMLMSKIFLKNKKYYFNTFPSKKYFEKQPQLHFQIHFIFFIFFEFLSKSSLLYDNQLLFFIKYILIKFYNVIIYLFSWG